MKQPQPKVTYIFPQSKNREEMIKDCLTNDVKTKERFDNCGNWTKYNLIWRANETTNNND